MTSTTPNAISPSQNTQPTVDASLQALRQVSFGAGQSQATARFAETQELRTFAASIQKSDPAFAPELFAAADLHEGL